MQPPTSLLAASRARQGYGIVHAAPQPTESLDSKILSIAAPSLLALALDPVLAAVDVAFVGRCGENSGAVPLAAVAASTGFLDLFLVPQTASPLLARPSWPKLK